MIQDPLLNEKDFYELYGLMHTPWWQAKIFWLCIVLGIILLSVIGTVLFVTRRRRMQRKKNMWAIALLEVDALAQSPYVAGEQADKIFYEQLLWIVKKFLGTYYGISLEAMTDVEVMHILSLKEDFPRQHLAPLREIFERAALAKFAHHTSMQAMRASDLVRVQRLINDTVPPKIVRS